MANKSLSKSQLSILDFWHKIEFFLPFDLQRELLDKDLIYKDSFTSEDLRCYSPTQIWDIPNLLPDEEPASYSVFFGVYDKKELKNQLDAILGDDKNPLNERLEHKVSHSCVAKIKLNNHACFDYGAIDIQLSTTPWAIGKIKSEGLDSLSFTQYDAELNQLKLMISHFANDKYKKDKTMDVPLTGEELLALSNLLSDWVNFKTQNTTLPLIYIQKNKRKKDVKKSNQKKETFNNDVNVDISILNSFYAKDIADVIRNNDKLFSPVLSAYLTPVNQKFDLYHQDKSIILEHLQPKFMNNGRWFEQSKYNMSLMQQFAINTIFKMQEQHLFSVNGPPGTGKTTLLKEIFAENIIRRAQKLASYKTVEETFETKKEKIEFNNSKPLSIRKLRSDLIGFEMVVASSNNAAVQNISEELPQSKSLGEKEWRDENGFPKVTYLQTIAQNMFSLKEKNNKYYYEKLELDKTPWGLFSCVLGNKKNRNFFVKRFFDDNSNATGYDIQDYQNIYQWKDNSDVISFEEAKNQFREKLYQVEDYKIKLSEYSILVKEIKSGTDEVILNTLKQEKERIKCLIQEYSDAIKTHQTELSFYNQCLFNVQEKYQLVKKRQPNFIQRLFNKKKINEYELELLSLLEEEKSIQYKCISISDICNNLNNLLIEKNNLLSMKEKELRNLQGHIKYKKEKFEELSSKFKEIDFTLLPEDLENDDWQIKGIWNSSKLNILRSELFQAALQLHESWLKEALTMPNNIAQNMWAINNLLSGTRYLIGNVEQQEKSAKLIWQTLFMIIPVVSTTFASFRYLFRHLRANSLGWLFVDEAGQAIPQAAVGALWRAKKAIIVGDPLQIEPVFTTPADFTEKLAEVSHLPQGVNANPHSTSVQVLADQANPFGARISDLWIGSPLRVHRRCVDPMFSIANKIAYEEKMVYGNGKNKQPPAHSIDLGTSAWIDITNTNMKEQIKREIDFAKVFIESLIKKYKCEPPLYIITPFREVKEQLQNAVKGLRCWKDIDKSGAKWAENNIGTVHTFQGKENQIVLLILGRNKENIGSALPLVSKPNLINVAATRAKHRFFIVGNYDLWTSHYPLFAQTAKILDFKIQGESFFKEYLDFDEDKKLSAISSNMT